MLFGSYGSAHPTRNVEDQGRGLVTQQRLNLFFWKEAFCGPHQLGNNLIDLFTDSDAILKILSVDFCGKAKVNPDSSSKIV